MNIIALPGDTTACGYYRVFAPLAALERAGLAQVKQPNIYKGAKGRDVITVSLDDLRGIDLAVFQRQPEARVNELFARAKAMGVKVVFDLDDDMYSVPPSSPAYLSWGKDWRKIGSHGAIQSAARTGLIKRGRDGAEMLMRDDSKALAAKAKDWAEGTHERFDGLIRNIRDADLVTVSTDRLREVYSKHRGDIEVLNNQIEPRDWADALEHPFERENDGTHWIGWAGSKTHWEDLQECASAVETALRENGAARLVLAGYPEAAKLFKSVKDQVITFDWMGLTEYRRIVAAFDVVLAPSAPLRFNEAKSDIRLLEAWLCGKPVVASDTTYGATVRKAGGGIIAKTSQKWVRALRQLGTNEALRRTMGEQGRAYVLAERTYDANAEQWFKVYERLVQGGVQ